MPAWSAALWSRSSTRPVSSPSPGASPQSGVEILSTGNTQRALGEAGVPVIGVGDYTGAPEILGGRVKTLHPRVHGGILYRRGLASDEADVKARDIPPIDLVVVNLYPFRQAVAAGKAFEDCVEKIDIGGPTMVRARRQERRARRRGGRPGRLRAGGGRDRRVGRPVARPPAST